MDTLPRLGSEIYRIRWKAKKHCTGLLALLACNATGGHLGQFSSLQGSLAKISQNRPVWNSNQSCWTERLFLGEQHVRRYALRAYRENPVADSALKSASTVCACARCKNLVTDKQLKRVLAAAASGTYRFHYASCLQDRSRGPLYWIQDCEASLASSVVVDSSREGTELNTEGRNSLRAGVPVWCKDETYASLSQCIRERDEALLYRRQVRTLPSSVIALSP